VGDKVADLVECKGDHRVLVGFGWFVDHDVTRDALVHGHAHLSTTETYLVEDDLEVIRRVRDHLAGRDEQPALSATGGATAPYRAEDLTVLFGQAGR
jgi:hypothetical protein